MMKKYLYLLIAVTLPFLALAFIYQGINAQPACSQEVAGYPSLAGTNKCYYPVTDLEILSGVQFNGGTYISSSTFGNGFILSGSTQGSGSEFHAHIRIPYRPPNTVGIIAEITVSDPMYNDNLKFTTAPNNTMFSQEEKQMNPGVVLLCGYGVADCNTLVVDDRYPYFVVHDMSRNEGYAGIRSGETGQVTVQYSNMYWIYAGEGDEEWPEEPPDEDPVITDTAGALCIFCPKDITGTLALVETLSETVGITDMTDFAGDLPGAMDLLSETCGISSTLPITSMDTFTDPVDMWDDIFSLGGSSALPGEVADANLIKNGSFENGLQYWSTGGGFLVDFVSGIASHGSWSAAFNIGQTGAVGDGISQSVVSYQNHDQNTDAETITVIFDYRVGNCLLGNSCDGNPPSVSVSVGTKPPSTVQGSYTGCSVEGDALNGEYYSCSWSQANIKFEDVGSIKDLKINWLGSPSSMYIDNVQMYHGAVDSMSDIVCVRPDLGEDDDGDGAGIPECSIEDGTCTIGDPIDTPVGLDPLPVSCIGTPGFDVQVPDENGLVFPDVWNTQLVAASVPSLELCFQPYLVTIEEDKIPFGSFLENGILSLGVVAFAFLIIRSLMGSIQQD
jgi:hypothetical protein